MEPLELLEHYSMLTAPWLEEITVAHAHNIETPVTLHFSLSRLQLVANPPERLVYGFLEIFWIFFFIVVLMVPGSWPVGILIAGTALALLSLLFRGPLQSLYCAITTGIYINTILVEEGFIHFGVNETTTGKWECRALTVMPGLFGTTIIRFINYSMVIPQNVISYKSLKSLIEQSRN
jgi:hypothetical protein